MDFSRDFEERHYQIPKYVGTIRKQMENAIGRVATASNELFLDGINLFEIIQHQFFRDIYNLYGYGQCYEAAALAMFCLKDNKTARLVHGTGECFHETKERCDHAWVEFYEDGVPFVADFAWFETEFCIPRIVHVDIAKSLVYYTMSYDEFWNSEFSKKIYELMHEKKTSDLYPWLIFYRSPKDEFGDMLIKKLGKFVVRNEKIYPTGEEKQYMYFHEPMLNKRSYKITTLKEAI